MLPLNVIEPAIKLRFKLDRLPLRDRWIAALLTWFGVLFFWGLVSYLPQTHALQKTASAIAAEQTEIQQLNDKRAVIESLAGDESINKLVLKYKQLQGQMSQFNDELKNHAQRTLSDKDLAKLLHSIVQKTSGVSIVEFSNTPLEITESTPSGAPAKTTASPLPQADMERIQYKLILKGDYFSIMDYFEKIEHTDWQLYWDKLDYIVKTYPEGLATIELYTLRPRENALKALNGVAQ